MELVNVVQVMLHRRILPCQRRASPMWAYRPKDEPTMRQLFRTTPEKLWKALFKPRKSWPAKEEDSGLSTDNPPTKVWHNFNPLTLLLRPKRLNAFSLIFAEVVEQSRKS